VWMTPLPASPWWGETGSPLGGVGGTRSRSDSTQPKVKNSAPSGHFAAHGPHADPVHSTHLRPLWHASQPSSHPHPKVRSTRRPSSPTAARQFFFAHRRTRTDGGLRRTQHGITRCKCASTPSTRHQSTTSPESPSLLVSRAPCMAARGISHRRQICWHHDTPRLLRMVSMACF